MAIQRQQIFRGQQRIDVPHIRAIESGVTADFDVLVGQLMSGGKALVVSGFVPTLTVGTLATTISIKTAGAIIAHPLATDAGTLLRVPTGRTDEILNATNTRVIGSFTAGTVNYIGVDLRRVADNSTADVVQFLDPNTNLENAQSVPLAATFDYVIYISTQDFSSTPTIAPLLKITTDSANAITVAEDARNMYFRLGSGGSVTNPLHTFTWTGGRTEVGNNSDFSVADKNIGSLKDWADAVMTRLWEVGGGEHWYSQTSDKNVKLVKTGGSMSSGDWFTWDGTNLTWQGLRLVFTNSTATYNDITDQTTSSAGLTDLAEGQCIYVDVDRTQNLTGGTALVAHKGTLTSLGDGSVPGSRYVIAWRSGNVVFGRDSGFEVGSIVPVATTTVLGIAKLHQASLTPSAPVVLSDGDLDTANGVPKLNANKQCTLVASGGNAVAFAGTGNGTGAGVSGTGGSGGGAGISGQGTSSGAGVLGTGGGAGGIGVDGTGGSSSGTGVRGTGGNNNGVGIVGQGTGSGSGGDFTGGLTGPAIITHGVASNDTPQLLYKDYAGNIKGLVDHNGYRMGRITEMVENWFNIKSTNTVSGLTPFITFWQCSVDHTSVTAASNASAFSIALSSTPVNNGAILWSGDSVINAPITFNSYSSVVMEWEMYMSVVGANNATIQAGISGAPSYVNLGLVDTAFFIKRSTDTNWQTASGNSTGSTTKNSGVAPLANTYQRFRVEIHGSASPYGARARFFINESLVNEHIAPTDNLPIESASPSMGGYFSVLATNTTTVTLVVSPLKVVWNRISASIPSL